jgi:TetR/AcrR family transcriptional regulator, regulator of cefoperazone and chloramphenicol sensitivity
MVERLLDIAIAHFGERGAHGISTRDIARDAGTPMSSITYHFGGKDGLYLAAAERVAARMGALMAPAFERAATLCGPDGDAGDARAALHVLTNRAVEVMVGPESEPLARFIMREQANPTEAFQRLYGGAMGGMMGRWVELLQRVAPRPMPEAEARLRAHALIGQILVFRTARASVLRSLGWEEVGAREVDAVRRVVAGHVDAVLDGLASDRGA